MRLAIHFLDENSIHFCFFLNLNLDLTNLKARFEEKINEVSKPGDEVEVIKKIKALKSSLVGGECANDVQLKEKRKRKKLAAQQRLSALARALKDADHTEARDILQGHYTDIQHELKIKTDALRAETKKVKCKCAGKMSRYFVEIKSRFFLFRRYMHWNVK